MRAYGSVRSNTDLLRVLERYLLGIDDVHDDTALANGQVVCQQVIWT